MNHETVEAKGYPTPVVIVIVAGAAALAFAVGAAVGEKAASHTPSCIDSLLPKEHWIGDSLRCSHSKHRLERDGDDWVCRCGPR